MIVGTAIVRRIQMDVQTFKFVQMIQEEIHGVAWSHDGMKSAAIFGTQNDA